MATKRHDKRPSESLAAERAAARYVKGLPDGWERKPPDEPPDEGVRAPAGLVESEHRRAPVLQSARDKFSAAARVVGQRPAQRLRWLLDIIERPREEIIAKLSRPSDLAFELSIFTGIADPQEFRLCLAEVISAIEAIEHRLRAL